MDSLREKVARALKDYFTEGMRENGLHEEAADAAIAAVVDAMRDHLAEGAEQCREAIVEAEQTNDPGFWRRYWAGYLKAYETLPEKLAFLQGEG